VVADFSAAPINPQVAPLGALASILASIGAIEDAHASRRTAEGSRMTAITYAQLLTVTDTADCLSVSVTTVRRWLRRGELDRSGSSEPFEPAGRCRSGSFEIARASRTTSPPSFDGGERWLNPAAGQRQLGGPLADPSGRRRGRTFDARSMAEAFLDGLWIVEVADREHTIDSGAQR
jgi:hypothetical protein